MKIWLTGGTGFIGSQVRKALQHQGKNVLAPTSRELDFFDPVQVQSFLRQYRPQMWIHTAWDTTHGEFWTSPKNEEWSRATLRAAEMFFHQSGERIVGLGTCAEYDWTGNTVMKESETPLRPETFYGRMKLRTFQELQGEVNAHDKEFLWGRVFFPYGPNEKAERVIPLMIRSQLSRQPLKMSSGLQTRDFMFTPDLGDLISRLALSSATGEVNLSTGESYTLRQAAQMIADISGGDYGLFEFQKELGPSDKNVIGDSTRRQSLLSWQPTRTLEAGLEETINWWKTQI